MTLQPIDLPSLLRAATWLLIAIFAVFAFRRPLAELVSTFCQRIRRLSFGGLSLELAEVSELKSPQALETEIRQLEAGLAPQSGASGISGLLVRLQQDGRHDYIVIDLGSDSSPRWLTSRLYLLALLISSIDRRLCLVFVETVGGIRKRFVGTAFPDRVRWALARRYGWLESASAAAYAILAGPAPAANFQFDPATGYFFEWQITQLVQQFLAYVRSPQPVADETEWDRFSWRGGRAREVARRRAN